MRRHKKLLLVGVGLLILFVVVRLALPKAEPTYKGKPLGYWAQQFSGELTPQQEQEAAAAIRALCTNAIPALVDALDYDGTPRRAKVTAILLRLPRFLQNALGRTAFPDSKELQAETAVTALEALGQDAVPAIPALTKLMASTNPTVSYRAIWTLSRLGTNGLTPLLRAVAEPGHPYRRSYVLGAIADMSYLGTNASPAIPVLVTALQDRDDLVRHLATNALLNIAPEALTNAPPQ